MLDVQLFKLFGYILRHSQLTLTTPTGRGFQDLNKMDPLQLIGEYYKPGSTVYGVLVQHSLSVAEKALAVADKIPHMAPDRAFIREAAILHDIGIFLTDSADLGCHGKYAYVCHGYLGRDLLEKKGMMRHALVCERHVGAGLTTEEIWRQQLPLPQREMRPETIEEQIICYADKFFSKDVAELKCEKSVREIVHKLSQYGPEQAARFLSWTELFREGEPNRKDPRPRGRGCGPP